MSVTLSLPTVLVPLAGGQRTLAASGETLGAVVADVARQYPQLAPRLRDEEGNPYRFVTFYVNDQDCRFLGGFDAPLVDGDEVAVVPAIAGGAGQACSPRKDRALDADPITRSETARSARPSRAARRAATGPGPCS